MFVHALPPALQALWHTTLDSALEQSPELTFALEAPPLEWSVARAGTAAWSNLFLYDPRVDRTMYAFEFVTPRGRQSLAAQFPPPGVACVYTDAEVTTYAEIGAVIRQWLSHYFPSVQGKPVRLCLIPNLQRDLLQDPPPPWDVQRSAYLETSAVVLVGLDGDLEPAWPLDAVCFTLGEGGAHYAFRAYTPARYRAICTELGPATPPEIWLDSPLETPEQLRRLAADGLRRVLDCSHPVSWRSP